VQLAPELESCARARLFVRSTLRRYGHTGDAVDDASVVSSELATNAVIHARTRFTVELQLYGDALRVEVSDGAPARWVPLEVPPQTWIEHRRRALQPSGHRGERRRQDRLGRALTGRRRRSFGNVGGAWT
jgi:anti-sigma regulatory factor (Ser/Thr protein kinase)